MTIDEAIEILELELHPSVKLSTHSSKDAVKLGIEALKRIQNSRRVWDVWNLGPLPGETKEMKGG